MGHYILHFSLYHRMWSEMTGHKYHHRWRGVGGLRYGPRHGSPEGGGGFLERGFNDPPRAQTFFLPPRGGGGSRSVKFVWETSRFKLVAKSWGFCEYTLCYRYPARGGPYQALFACVPPTQLQTP